MRGNYQRHRAKKAIGAGCAAAMIGTTMAFVATPAQAESDDTIVTEIAPTEDPANYAGWHQGYADAEHTFGLTADGLMMSGKSQVINGYENNSNDLSGEDNVRLRRTLRLATYELASGQAWFQVALFFDNTKDGEDNPTFTTLRPADPGTVGRNEVGMRVTWQTSGAINTDYPKNATAPLGELLHAIGENRKTIGFGVLTTPNTEAVVESIDWDDETYRFRAPENTSETVTDSDIDLDEVPYAGWHQGAVNEGVPGEHRVTAQGLELDGRSQVIKGYDNNSDDLDSRNVHLPSAVQNASYDVAEGTVHFQIPLFFTAPGQTGVGFTTLRPADPAQVGENDLSLDDDWIASRGIGSVPANTATPLRELIAEMTEYKVLGFGVYNESGHALVNSITFDGVQYTFADTTKQKNDRVFYKNIADHEDPDSTYTQWHQGANNGDEENPDWGEYEINNDGLLLTGRSQVINGARKANNVSLQHALRDASYNVVDGNAWFQVALFIDADGDDSTDPDFTTLRPAAPAELGENTISMQDEWVSSGGFGDVQESKPTPLGDLVNAVGSDYTVLAFGVFSDKNGSATVDRITWNDTTYRFVNRAPNAVRKHVKTRARRSVTVRLPKVDRDGNTVRYEFGDPVNGKLKADGRKATYKPRRNFTGKDRFRYTVTDPYGKTDSGHVIVRVRKLNARIARAVVRPKRLTPNKRARVYVRVRSGGEAAKGRVLVREGRKVLGARWLKNGARTVWLGRLDRGKHKLTVRYAGNKTSQKAVKRVTVRVRRR